MDSFFTSYVRNLSQETPDETITLFYSIMNLKQYKKGDTLIDHNKKNINMFIIKSGLVASFITNEDGSDFIRTIFKKNDEIASLRSLITNENSNANYKCLLDCEVYEASFDDFMRISNTNHQLSILHIKVLQKIYLVSEKRITELSSLDGTKRYLQLKKDIPNIDNLLPQYQIANYLNITPVQLSRIRKKIFSK